MASQTQWPSPQTQGAAERRGAVVVRLNLGMAANLFVDPTGNEWVVRRRWVHRKLRWRGRGRKSLDLIDGAEVGAAAADIPGLGTVLTVVVILLLAVAAVLFIVPAVIFLVELLIVVALVGLGLLGCVLLGRPWTVEAHQQGADHAFEWKATGWRASGELVRSVGEQLRSTGQTTGGDRVSLAR
jgi:hypothetical protein